MKDTLDKAEGGDQIAAQVMSGLCIGPRAGVLGKVLVNSFSRDVNTAPGYRILRGLKTTSSNIVDVTKGDDVGETFAYVYRIYGVSNEAPVAKEYNPQCERVICDEIMQCNGNCAEGLEANIRDSALRFEAANAKVSLVADVSSLKTQGHQLIAAATSYAHAC